MEENNVSEIPVEINSEQKSVNLSSFSKLRDFHVKKTASHIF